MLFISKGLGTKIQTNSIKNLALFFFFCSCLVWVPIFFSTLRRRRLPFSRITFKFNNLYISRIKLIEPNRYRAFVFRPQLVKNMYNKNSKHVTPLATAVREMSQSSGTVLEPTQTGIT